MCIGSNIDDLKWQSLCLRKCHFATWIVEIVGETRNGVALEIFPLEKFKN